MIFLKLENVKPGMFLGRSIYSQNQILLAEETQLTNKYISRLQELGVSGAYIANHISKDLEIYDVVANETRQKAIHLAKKTLTRIKKPEDITPAMKKAISRVVNNIIEDLLKNRDLTFNLYNIKTFDDYIFQHSVNVCLFSLVMGLARGYNEKKLLQLGIGAFMHDLGKLQVPETILNKPGRLTEEEFTFIQEHPTLGYEILKKSDEIDFVSSNILYQHHEKLNGCGYPKGVQGKSIHEYARIVAIADIYDAITSHRVYNKPMPNHEAIELLIAYASQELDEELVHLFLQHIPAFPLGTCVHLNNQSRGVVIEQNKGLPLRPLLMILEEKGREVKPYELDLTEEISLVIERTD